MRQIQVGAWLVMVVSLGCSGERFSTPDQGAQSAQPDAPNSNLGSGDVAPSDSEMSAGGESIDAEGGRPGQGTAGTGGGSKVNAGASAGGNAATGGTYGAGGTSAVGGSAGSGGRGESCPVGTITFRMLAGAEISKDYLCDVGCGTGWLTITDADGAQAFSISSACGTASCETCAVTTCAAAACMPTPLGEKGSELSWSGTYLAKDTCGMHMACQKQACVKPGKYRAKACASLSAGSSGNGSCMPSTSQLCAEAEFEFPSTQTLKLILKK